MALTPKRILVPIDFSPASDCALDLASQLADPFKAEIHLLHVRSVIDNPTVSPDDLREVEKILAMSDGKAQQVLEKSATGIDVPTHCHIRRDVSPADAIIDAIEKHHCDLVIMGTFGRRGLRRLFVGSVAKEVTHRSPVPVVTTRGKTGRTFPPKKILVAYDSSEDSLNAVLLAATWAPLLSAEITLLHVMELEIYPGLYSHYAPSASHIKRVSRQCQEALVKVGMEQLGAVNHEIAVIHAHAAPGITEFASANTFDLVVLATRGLSRIAHALLGSVAERVTQLSEVPVLTVQKPPRASGETSPKKKGAFKRSKRATRDQDRPTPISVERSPDQTVIRFHDRESLAGADLGLIEGLWDILEDESDDPKSTVVVVAPPGLLGPANLERLLGGPRANNSLTAANIRARIIREENVIQRYIKAIRGLDSFVIGLAGGDIALHLAAPLLACDYRIVSPDTVFVNTTQTLPRAPFGCLPWLLAKKVGGAKTTQLLLDVPKLSAEDARALGLVNHVTSSARFEDEAFEVVERLASLPRSTLIGLKRCMTAATDDFHSYLSQEMALTEQLASAHWAVH